MRSLLVVLGVAVGTLGFALTAVWAPDSALFEAEPIVILIGIALIPCVISNWRRPDIAWFVLPVAGAGGTLVGLLALIAVVHIAWPSRLMGCYVHTTATGGFGDWVCLGPVPFVTEGWPAIVRAAWLAGLVLAVLGLVSLALRPVVRFCAWARVGAA